MTNVVATIATVKQDLPAGQTAAGKFRFQLLDTAGAVVQTQDSDQLTVTFADVAVGSYTVAAVALDTTGAVLGTAVSGSVVVPEPVQPAPVVEQFDAPASISVSLS